MLGKIKKWFKKSSVGKFLAVSLLLSLVSIPAIYQLLKPGYYSNHDGEGHIIRLQEFDIALKDGQFPPRVSKNLMYGYGYYFFNFNYPLVHWMGEAAHVVGFGYVDSVKVVSILGLILSGIAMFAWQRHYWGRLGAFAAGVLYMYAPYRLLTLYVRGALAEHLAFMTLPLLFLATEKIAEGDKKKRLKYVLLGAISYALLMLSHNIIAFIFSAMLGLFMLFHVVLYKKFKLLINYGVMLFLGMGMSAFFWFPALSEKKFVRLDQTIGQDFPDHFVYFRQLFDVGWGFGGSGPGLNDGLSFQVGIFNWIVLILALPVIYLLWKKLHAKAMHMVFYLFLFLLSLFFMLPVSRAVWDNLPLFPFIQFPWRFLSWTIFVTSILGGTVVYYLEKRYKRAAPKIVVIGIIMLVVSSYGYYQVNERVLIKLPGNRPIQGSTTWADEQFPIWYEPKPSGFPKGRIEIVEGKGRVEVESWKTGAHKYEISASQSVKVVENTAYYPGWVLIVNGVKHDFDYEDSEYPGRIVYQLPAGEYRVLTKFRETNSRKVADYVSLGLGGAVVASLLYVYVRDRG